MLKNLFRRNKTQSISDKLRVVRKPEGWEFFDGDVYVGYYGGDSLEAARKHAERIEAKRGI